MRTAVDLSPDSFTGIRREAGSMARHAAARVEATYAWFGELSADDRSWIGVIAHGGIMSFITWLENPSTHDAGLDIFADAPRELTRSISLQQTLDLIRTVIDVVEAEAPDHVSDADSAAVREAVLHFSREVAFGAAQVYAKAAESRGGWDARLESLVVDAVIRGETDDSLGSRVSALGWEDVRGVAVVVGASPHGGPTSVVDPLRRAARHAGLELLVSVDGRRMIAVVGGIDGDPLDAAGGLAEGFGDGPVVCGPLVPHLFAAGRSARDALRGFGAAAAAPQASRPVRSHDLLAARAVSGDDWARRSLAQLAAAHLPAGTTLGETARAYLRLGSLEATARALFVHANTVRYRLGRIEELTGHDLTVSDEAFAVRLAVMYADLDAARSSRRFRPDSNHSERERTRKLSPSNSSATPL